MAGPRRVQFGLPILFTQAEHAQEIAQHDLKVEMLQTTLKDQTKDAEAASRKAMRLQASLDQREVMDFTRITKLTLTGWPELA